MPRRLGFRNRPSAEGEPGAATIWIDTETRQLLRIEATLPQMGGAKLTSELTK